MNRPTDKSYTAVSTCESTDDVEFGYDGEIYSTEITGTSLPTGWTKSQYGVSVSNQVQITGNNTWDRYVKRISSIEDGEAARFSFKVNNTGIIAVY